MEFINVCNCIVDYDVLEKSIIEECKRRNIEPKDNYKIYDYRGYAGISLKHEKVSVHRIIGKYMVGYDFGSEICVHHIDRNHFNNDISNLQVMRNDLHIKEHNIVQYVSKDYMNDFGNRMRNIVSRNDVTKEMVLELRNNGLTISKIAERLKCGINTVNRRLGMKDY